MSYTTQIESPMRLLLEAEAQILAARTTVSKALDNLDPGRREHSIASEKQDLDRLAALARRMIIERRLRDRLLDLPEIFGEPAWDIMLDLFVASVDNRLVSTTSACLSSTAPATTGLRYLRVLEDKGLVERVPDEEDGRVVNVRLTESAVGKMVQLLSRYAKSSPVGVP